MPKAAKPAVRGRRPRAEVQQEFEDIRAQAERDRETPDPKAEEAARIREMEVRAAVEGVSVESVVQRISGLGLEVSRALADVSGKLVDEVNLLGSVREAVALERKELERLHNIDVAATALDQMVQDYGRQNQIGGGDRRPARRVGAGIGTRRTGPEGAGRGAEEAAAARNR